MDHEETHGHECDCNKCSEPQAPKGSSSHGWLWIVGIIIVVAIILIFLQGNVPESADDTLVDEPVAEEVLEDEGTETLEVVDEALEEEGTSEDVELEAQADAEAAEGEASDLPETDE